MDKAYEAKQHEDRIAEKWEKAKAFQAIRPQDSRSGESFVIPLPPPNVTGTLHLGHAAMLVVEDIMCRYHRMAGDATLWVPGTDHAAIATETVVLKHLGIKDRNKETTRDKFIGECWKWTKKAHDTITNQIRKMGASIDWTRERFTMDMGLSGAVNTIFHDLYEAGLIYRGGRMINWSVGAQSVLADDEVEYKEVNGKLYYYQYFFKDDPKNSLVVATTRPETLFGDTALAVNPKDKRYKSAVGKKVIIPFSNKEIPVIADPYVDLKFGTGCLKITPSHDPNDYEIGRKHKLEARPVIGFDGKMKKSPYVPKEYEGLTREECRKRLSDENDAKVKKYLLKIEPYVHSVGFCYRSHTAIEPMVSTQWFIDVNKAFVHPILKKKTTLKKLTVDAVKKGDVKIIPGRFNKTYFQWVDNLRDWCISRQIWWGHRIPVWYDKKENIHLPRKQNLIFARHGESESNAKMVITSRNDSPLTDLGKSQAAELAEKLKKEKKVKMIISSPLARAKSTGEIIAKKLGVKLVVWDELLEIDCGDITEKDMIPGRSVFERMLEKNTGEALEGMEKRAKTVWEKIEKLDPVDGDILFIGHGMFTSILFALRDGVHPEHYSSFRDDRWRMKNAETREMTHLIAPKGKDLRQDEDTLDTWFSSALWPFSTLGWPDAVNQDFRDFFPTSILETGHDILFFWVARMIMFSLFATGKSPFHTVYLHGLVCDEKGQKMSKSKGNGIDPLAMIDKFGTDALRMAMIVGTTPGNPINLGEKKVEGYRNFANKIWNIARYIFSMNIPAGAKLEPKTHTDKWLLSKTQHLIRSATEGLRKHHYGEVGSMLYKFAWSELADWGIEASKADSSENTALIFREALKSLLMLLHPYTPFVTEKIWESMGEKDLLTLTPWPKPDKKWESKEAEQDFESVKAIVMKIRSLRSEKKIEPSVKIEAVFSGKKLDVLRENENIVKFLASLSSVVYGKKPPRDGISDYVSGTEIFLVLEGVIDEEAEKMRIERELENLEKLIRNLDSRLSNESYVKNAPPRLVEETRRQLQESSEKVKRLKEEKKKYA